MKVLVNRGGFEWRRTAGDHAQLYYERPTDETDKRHVTVPLHDELRAGTLRGIADAAGAHDFDDFCAWIDRNS
ncbi:YcfA family protein [Halorubrum californiense DSM 19288]|uniref:YcfA family protein n=1 Tax=Halorubrum californiense DSM 19288 TaxID=1227465 RepID=M0EMN7_9EURY|nr:YcfA family protein [Halorubrum californiense DSM 19288]